MTQRLLAKIGLAACVLVCAALWPAAAQQQIKLTIVSGNAPTFTPVGAAIEGFIPKVDELLAKSGKYKITWV